MFEAVSARLHDALHELYPDPCGIRTLALAADLDLGAVPAASPEGPSLDEVLRAASGQSTALSRLVKAALEAHGRHVGLQVAAQQPLLAHVPWECPQVTRNPVMNSAGMIATAGTKQVDRSAIPLARLRAAAVGLIEVPLAHGWTSASGVLLAHDLFVTTHHALGDAGRAASARVVFSHDTAETGLPAGEMSYRCDRDRLFHTSEADDLTVVALAGEPTTRWGSIPWQGTDAHLGDVLSWVGHPEGQPRTISKWRAIITGIEGERLQVLTTKPLATPGIALFNSNWQLVGLHRSGALLPTHLEDALSYRNEAVSARALARLIPEPLQR